jgi:phospholipid/cholesterol/gamma-HCH transport system permease protein
MRSTDALPPAAALTVDRSRPDKLVLIFTGRLDAAGTAALWQRALDLLERENPKRLLVETSGVDYCDGTGIGLLVEIERRMRLQAGKLELSGLRPEFRRLLDQFDPGNFAEVPSERPRPASLPAAPGELSVALLRALRRPGSVRWRDVWLIMEKAGVDALPIVALISFLVGLIMAFQAAVPMRQFGTEIYVANLIGLAVLRELGVLMTAIILAGRSGSAFAAELGTMKINEEIDALATMGLDPVPFLVVPRVLAALFVTPLLTLFADLIGIVGGSIVLLSMGYPMVTYIRQVESAVSLTDFGSGLSKSFVFGLIVAAIGCLHGLRAEAGPSAVGDAATRAVVSGIILIVISDGVFSVLFYYLGI